MSSVETGRAAEQLAADWLQARHFHILDRNWRTRWCEVDIVARRHQTVHFVEVKYRRRADFGNGLEAITSAKLIRLQRSALMWRKAHPAAPVASQLDVIAITGHLSERNLIFIPGIWIN